MRYLESDYRLSSVNTDAYQKHARVLGDQVKALKIGGALAAVTAAENPDLSSVVQRFGAHLNESYGEGGELYCVAFGVGLSVLREVNPASAVVPIQPEDWTQIMVREAELREDPRVRFLEDLCAKALLEIADVNAGYTEGHKKYVYTNRVIDSLETAFTDMGAWHAHDLLHFASSDK